MPIPHISLGRHMDAVGVLGARLQHALASLHMAVSSRWISVVLYGAVLIGCVIAGLMHVWMILSKKFVTMWRRFSCSRLFGRVFFAQVKLSPRSFVLPFP